MSGGLTNSVPGRVLLAIPCAVLATLALGAVLTPAAAAKTFKSGPLHYVVDTDGAAPDSDESAGQPCPDATRLTGGGGGIARKPLDQSHLWSILPYNVDADADPDDAFVTDAYNAPGEPATVTSASICLRPGRDALRYEAASTEWSAGPHEDVITTGAGSSCSGGWKAVGGGAGWEGPTGSALSLRTSHHYGDFHDPIWAAVGDKGSTAEPRDLTASVICLPDGARRVKERRDNRNGIAPGGAGSLRVACPDGFRVSGGAIGSSVQLISSMPYDGHDRDRAPDDGWRGRIFNTADQPGGLAVSAFCVGKA